MKDIEKTVYNAIKNGTYTTFDTLKDSYVHLYEQIEALKAENARLTEQLENSVKLPCKVGDTVYIIPSKVNFDLNRINGHEENNRVYTPKVESIISYKDKTYLLFCNNGITSCLSEFYKINWFLTEAEAEARLKELEAQND